jgi:hypothetical protein
MCQTPAFLRISCQEGFVDVLMILLVAILVLSTWGLIRLCEKL